MNNEQDFDKNLHDLMYSARKQNATFVIAEQDMSHLQNHYVVKNGRICSDWNSNAPFIHYITNVLKGGDKVPRGKHFKNRITGHPVVLVNGVGNLVPIIIDAHDDQFPTTLIQNMVGKDLLIIDPPRDSQDLFRLAKGDSVKNPFEQI